MFRGVLNARAKEINYEMKIAAAHAIADCVPEDHISSEYIIPSIFDKNVTRKVAREVAKSARSTGVARKKSKLDLKAYKA